MRHPYRSRILAVVSIAILWTAVAWCESEPCDTALLVIDMQTLYLRQPLVTIDYSPIAERVGMILERAREAGIPVIYTKNLDSSVAPDAEELGFPESLAPLGEDIVILKTKPNPFIGTDLETVLRDAGITRLIVCGIYSTCCVKYAVLSAADLGFEVVVIEDGHGDYIMNILEAPELNDRWDGMSGVSVLPLADLNFARYCPSG